MNTKLRQSLETMEGYEKVLRDSPPITHKDPDFAEVDVFNFKLNGMIFKCTQISAALLTVNKIEVSFRFPTLKKQDKNNLHVAVNSYNKSKIGMKAVLDKLEKDFFQISFSVEFMCPDSIIVDEIIHPAVKVLRTGGKLFLANLGAHGITIKDTKKND